MHNFGFWDFLHLEKHLWRKLQKTHLVFLCVSAILCLDSSSFPLWQLPWFSTTQKNRLSETEKLNLNTDQWQISEIFCCFKYTWIYASIMLETEKSNLNMVQWQISEMFDCSNILEYLPHSSQEQKNSLFTWINDKCWKYLNI